MTKEKKIDQKKRKESEKKMKKEKEKMHKKKTILHDAGRVIKKEHHGYIHHITSYTWM